MSLFVNVNISASLSSFKYLLANFFFPSDCRFQQDLMEQKKKKKKFLPLEAKWWMIERSLSLFWNTHALTHSHIQNTDTDTLILSLSLSPVKRHTQTNTYSFTHTYTHTQSHTNIHRQTPKRTHTDKHRDTHTNSHSITANECHFGMCPFVFQFNYFFAVPATSPKDKSTWIRTIVLLPHWQRQSMTREYINYDAEREKERERDI